MYTHMTNRQHVYKHYVSVIYSVVSSSWYLLTVQADMLTQWQSSTSC